MSSWQHGPLGRLLAGWLLFSAGQWTFVVAAAVFAFDHDGSGGVAAVTAARLLPAMFAAPVAGALIDRYDRSRVVLTSCAALAAALAAAAAVVISGRPLMWLVLVTVAASAVGTPPRPALQALLPSLARTPAELMRATAAWAAFDSVGFLAGAGVGGLVIALAGAGAVIAAAAGCVALTTVLVAGLPSASASLPGDEATADGGLFAGLRAVLATPMLHVPFALLVGLLLLDGAADVQLVALAIKRLHLGNGGPGLLYVVWGIGGLLGSGALLRIMRRCGYGRALQVGATAFGLLLGLSGVAGVVVAIIAMIGVGIGFSLVENALIGVVPRLADDAVIGRVYGLSELLYTGVTALGALLAPALVHWLGIGGSLAATGFAYAACVLATFRGCARLDRGEQAAARVRDLLHGVPFLAPLPLPQLERLVRSARPVTVGAGEPVVRAGEIGDAFFVVESGEVDIVEYGRRHGPGEGFGEIALLSDVPRTATVRARTPARLWAVGRPAFLAAVGASEDARTAAHGAVAEHLARSPRVGPVGP